mmetsp:Transcript_11847/g.24444  ORF Transcript_11847/g.24444 Transcript_11847/m.24444 type:complete len:528 (+) Transcript_11847:126-1709(+)
MRQRSARRSPMILLLASSLASRRSHHLRSGVHASSSRSLFASAFVSTRQSPRSIMTTGTRSFSTSSSKSDAAQSCTSQNSKKRKRKASSFGPPPDPSTFPPWSYEPKSFFRYELIHKSSKSQARVGRIHTPHGIIDTPGYVAVATNGALKGVDFHDADDAGQQLVFCNSYHLMLQPGPDVIRDAGGLHNFIGRRDRPLITDSGGFQVFSLAYGGVHEERSSGGTDDTKELKRSGGRRRAGRNDGSGGGSSNRNGGRNVMNSDGGPPVKCTEEGVKFRSYRDGRKIMLTPESTVQAQKAYGADIIIPLDELPPHHTDREVLAESVDRTHRWEARSLVEHLRDVREQAMYCVVHGGLDVQLRTKSVEYLTSLPFDGYAIGGSLGKNADDLKELLEWMMPMFDEKDRRDKPRHLLGIADEGSVLNAIKKGVDTFDSCYPTRLGRHGALMTTEEGMNGRLYIKSGRHSRSYGIPIDPNCQCLTCQRYDRAYLWHLYKAKEPLFMQLATLHNIQYMNDMMARYRQDILDDKI